MTADAYGLMDAETGRLAKGCGNTARSYTRTFTTKASADRAAKKANERSGNDRCVEDDA